jgi:N6-adenosine-specific RNA methylase IME4
MTLGEMREFWMKEMESHIKPDCHLFCWTTQTFLRAAIDLVEACGFTYVRTHAWIKPGGFQPVGQPQYNIEFIVYARRGAPVFIDTKDFKCGFEAPRREHSRKPAKFYETIARVTGGSRLDVFARERHPGFAQYGNEVDRFDATERAAIDPEALAGVIEQLPRRRENETAAEPAAAMARAAD